MAVSNAHHIHDDAVARTALDEVLEYLRRDPMRRVLVWVELLQEAADVVAVLSKHLCEGHAVGDALDEALPRSRREHAVRCEAEVEALLLEERVHEAQHLEHELVLPHVVSRLEDDGVVEIRRPRGWRDDESQPERRERRLEDGGALGHCAHNAKRGVERQPQRRLQSAQAVQRAASVEHGAQPRDALRPTLARTLERARHCRERRHEGFLEGERR
mmetsp:Transcript_47686/g.110527  ORF Transcript_47686/g.110527 Transcript_47686/m.110527 type:complete len:216 (-) Transcript_47686:181-828(-)